MDPSKEGLLNTHRSHRSYEDHESDLESDIDATDYLNTDPLVQEASSPKPAFLTGRRPGRFISLQRPFRSRSRCCIIVLGVVLLTWVLVAAGGFLAYTKYKEAPPDGLSPPWYPSPKGGIAKSWAESYEKAAAMVSRMTLPEKVNVTTGTGWRMGLAVGTNAPAVHVGFPQLNLQDGPLGIRFADNATAFPAGITVGATWNRELMYERGKAHGLEARLKGVNVLLGPCVGPLGRMPAGGRNWEGFGADPYLQGIAGAETVKGIQSQHVMATIKHFVANEQEHFRQSWEWGLPNAISSNIDDRTLHELYAWPFGDAVKAGVASVMCSYNMVNNSYACGNSKLLNGILKDELGFQGFVMSDWLAQRSGVASALAGLDMTMPGDGLFWENGVSLWGPQLTKAVLNGSVPVDRLNDMATRIVASWYQLGQDDETLFDKQGPNFSSWTDDKMGLPFTGSPSNQETVEVNKFVNVQGNHSILARQVAAEGIVLLKNEGLLPISREGYTDAKRKRHSGKLRVGIFGEDAGPGQGPNYCKDRGCNQGTLGSGWGSGAVEFPYLVAPVDALRDGFNKDKVNLTEYVSNAPGYNARPGILNDQDVCLVFANSDSGEGFLSWGSVGGDRPDLLLQKGADDLVVMVAKHCGGGAGETVVVIHSVGPVVMERWIDLPGVKAVIWANLPGQESGNALADVIFGDVNPSGRLPYTIGKSLKDYGAGGQVMYLPNGIVPQQDFSEGLYIDYRHFDKFEVEPRFEFGFGLSYTTFEYANLTVAPVKAKTVLPAARPAPGAQPPKYDDKIPNEKEALFPDGFRKLEKYIYPYLDSVDDIVTHPYPYPDGYNVQQLLSGAGGDEGGNPDLWETYVSVGVDVRNTGAMGGKAVPQLYLAYPQGTKVDFPVKVLRGFDKIYLDKGETQRVTFNITRRDLSYWDVHQQNWMMVLGKYTFMVGASSRDLTAFGSW
jgi:beta-glucosidase-like glycosyl hydrolase